MTNAISPASLAPPESASTRASSSPEAGETALTVAATTREGRSSSMSAARPITARRNGTTARQICSASARLLVKPSPYRKRTKDPTRMARRPWRLARCHASSASSSSPSISVVTGTVRAVVMAAPYACEEDGADARI